MQEAPAPCRGTIAMHYLYVFMMQFLPTLDAAESYFPSKSWRAACSKAAREGFQLLQVETCLEWVLAKEKPLCSLNTETEFHTTNTNSLIGKNIRIKASKDTVCVWEGVLVYMYVC